jgi:hypothetical protein
MPSWLVRHVFTVLTEMAIAKLVSAVASLKKTPFFDQLSGVPCR